MLRPLWHGLPAGLAELSAELQKVFAPDLTSYGDSVRNQRGSRSFKVINDPIWFTIRVESWELVLLDSPLIQRLRNIHQLGLAGLVYPAAGYSRFEHTIGVLYQAQRLIESINRNARAHSVKARVNTADPISHSDEVQLRLAALLHDIGHCFLSHVSERALGRLSVGGIELETVRRQARTHFGSPTKPAIAEIISGLMILLPEFRDLLTLARIPSWEGKEDELALFLTKLVVRGRFLDRPFMNEIISGALDADKLDYMPRDCYMAGLAMPIDVERLLEKVCVVNLPSEDPVIEEYVQESGLSPNENIQVLAIQQGGAKVFEDLVVSRVLLFDKLYNHQKVRAMESAVVSALELLREHHPSFREVSTYLRISDSQFLECRWPEAPAEAKQPVQTAKNIVRDLQSRLFVRSIAFGPKLITNYYSVEEGDQRKLGESWRRLKDIVSREAWSSKSDEPMKFRARLCERTRMYLRAVGQPALANELQDCHIIIDLPDPQGIAGKTKSFVGDESSGIRKFNDLFRVEKWAEAYESQKITGYVFCPSEVAIAVHVAFRDIVREEFDLRFEDWSWSLTKISPKERDEFTARLIERGVKTEPAPTPAIFKARELYLASHTAKMNVLGKYSEVVDELGDRFKTFQSSTGEEVTRHRIQNWLLQFDPDEIPLAIRLLQHVRYWDRAAITDAFATTLKEWNSEDIRTGEWIPLGGSTTSSIHLNYLWPDLKKQGYCPTQILQSALELTGRGTIVFYDDNVGSAGQSITVLQQWTGVPQESWVVNEYHVQPLLPDKLEILRKAKIRFLFATGRRQGLRALILAAKQMLGNDNIDGHIVHPEEVSCFRPASGIFGDKPTMERAEETFRKAGLKAVSDRAKDWGQEKTNQRLLGYGNHGGLNVFYYNVPTATVTALWKSSTLPSSCWIALFPRRPRE